MTGPTCTDLRGPRATWTWILALIVGSYLLDGTLLGALSATGVLPGWVVLAYVGAGLASCGAFYAAIASGWSARWRDNSLALPQMVVAVAIQLSFMLLAPAAAWYFVTVLFVVFAFAGLRLRAYQAVLAVTGVVAAVVAIATVAPEAVALPGDTATQRVLVVLCIGTVLIRCTLIGVFGSRLRAWLARGWAETRRVLDANEQRGAAVAHALQDGLGQELTGTSLILSACARRLREEGHAGAPEVETAVEHLREAIRKTRLLARAASAAPPSAVSQSSPPARALQTGNAA